ncbi:glycoside hydrolase family 2 protein [Siculibacillus lacustris]|uniref:Glycoside hydrolase family 2 protein n=1 Tax=Siculibacillus lacustris TaxID=1549641 RepID=A0A4Q9VG70_9HYPH|nr:glycoside hydrolase family 2 protein [Siculibacillus lacustris]TBW33879.1 glycoside hydrolase family 2 protein [Siculibacillus lacustris]
MADPAPALILDTGWTTTATPPGAWATPADIAPDGVEWLPAIMPGTVAGALAAAGRWSLDAPTPLHDRDHWYRCRLTARGRRRLIFEGLATVAEVFLDGRPILTSRSMFLTHAVEVELSGDAELAIVFRSLAAHLELVRPKRARWRTALIPDQRLRAVRTTLLGHMPGWCPAVDVIGPWRPIRLVDPTDPAFVVRDLAARYDGIDGRLTARLDVASCSPPPAAALVCAGRRAPFRADGDGALVADLVLPGIAPWWPNGLGEPTLHDVAAEIDGRVVPLGRTGFRTLSVDRDADGCGFGLVVNGVPVFARGTVWTPSDPVGLPGDRGAHAADLERLAAAGLNMIRIAGIGAYETPAFHDLCDERGILVWQDLMFANFDYPSDPDFTALGRAETEQVLARLALSPSLAVVCGGSEITQQAAMTGLPPAAWAHPLFDEVLPKLVAARRPDVAWVRSTPDGGAMPFVVDVGVGHYYGVGAYRRPLDDARRARVRFAAECLAFAHVPDEATLDEGLAVPFVHHPRWKDRVPRDPGAAWDFEDVRCHYEAEIFGPTVPALRLEDPARARDVARATTAHVVESTFAEWRRPGSPTRGALVFLHRDLRFGAGWGFVDAAGRPKSSWYALARAALPLALLLADEGVNGLDCHLANETATPVAGRLELAALADGRLPVASGARDVEVPARGSLSFAATELFGAFFDTTRAYRFGPPAHDLTHARLVAADGRVLAEAFHVPGGRSLERHDLGLTARLDGGPGAWELVIGCTRAALSVAIDDPAFEPADSGFHLAPGERRVRLARRPTTAPEATPQGRVRALNGRDGAGYRL